MTDSSIQLDEVGGVITGSGEQLQACLHDGTDSEPQSSTGVETIRCSGCMVVPR